MSEQCPSCNNTVYGAVTLQADSFALVCPVCQAKYVPAGPKSYRPRLLSD